MIGRRHSQCKGPEVEKEPQEIRTGQAEEPGNRRYQRMTLRDKAREAWLLRDIL